MLLYMAGLNGSSQIFHELVERVTDTSTLDFCRRHADVCRPLVREKKQGVPPHHFHPMTELDTESLPPLASQMWMPSWTTWAGLFPVP